MASILDFAVLSSYAYNTSGKTGDDSKDGQKTRLPAGFSVTQWEVDAGSGFAAVYCQRGNEVVIAYRGTNNLIPGGGDLMEDIRIGRGRPPQTSKRANDLYLSVKQAFPSAQISVTGHSLGGGLAQMVAAISGVYGVTFNAPGMLDEALYYGARYARGANVTNYRHRQDQVSGSLAGAHVGSVQILHMPNHTARWYNPIGGIQNALAAHSMDDIVRHLGGGRYLS